MSNPISSLPEKPEDESALEVEDLLDEQPPASLAGFETASQDDASDDDEKTLQETEETSSEAPAAADEAGIAAEEAPEKKRSGRMGLLALVLAGLLLVSVAINLKQSGDVGRLEAERAELQQAVDAAVERIDSETLRANGAEAALDRVDRAVDVVNERVLGLQEALDGLREATVR